MAQDSRYGWGWSEQYATPALSQASSGYGQNESGFPVPGTWIPQPQHQNDQHVALPPSASYWGNDTPCTHPNQFAIPQQACETTALGLGISTHGYQPTAGSYNAGYQAPPPVTYPNSYEPNPSQILTPGPQPSFVPSQPPGPYILPTYYTNSSPYQQAANSPWNHGSTPSPNPPFPSRPYHDQRPSVNQPFEALTVSSQYPPGSDQRWGFQPQPPNYLHQNIQHGRRRALLIGINYFGHGGDCKELRGAINDARRVRDFLVQNYGYTLQDIVILTDDYTNPLEQPATKASIEYEMRRLVAGSEPGDSLFFHFSGHGGQTPAEEDDEEDGMDEIIFPVDWESQGIITDNFMHTTMVQGLQRGVKLTAVFDSCHSGTALDLHYIYRPDGNVKAPTYDWKDVSHEIARVSKRPSFKAFSGIIGSVRRTRSSYQQSLKTKTTDATVVMFSGAKDSQNAKDTVQDGLHIGAMSWAFTKALTKQPRQSYIELLNNIRHELRHENYSQTPQLSCSHSLGKRDSPSSI